MASDSRSKNPANAVTATSGIATSSMTTPGVDPMPPAARRRLQQCYEQGMKLMESEKCDFDYANTMFTQCVVSDPGNLIYVEALLTNLDRKYGSNKKGSRFPTLGGSKSAFKKAIAKKDWAEALKLGPDALKANPWDSSILRGMAEACEAFDFREVELRYLRMALDADPKNAEVNRHCAKSLQRMGQFDQAIACWHRVEEAKRDDPEAPKMISAIQTEKTRARAGFGPAQVIGGVNVGSAAKVASGAKVVSTAKSEVKFEAKSAPVAATVPAPPVPPAVADAKPGMPPAASSVNASRPALGTLRQLLEQSRAENPADVETVLKLARLLVDEGDTAEADRILTESLAVSGHDLRVREQLEEVHVADPRRRLAVAERLAEESEKAESTQLVQQLKVELARAELAFYTVRTERYPANLELKFQLAMRLRRLGNYAEAIKVFAQSAEGESLRAASLLEVGECQQRLKQYPKALDTYRQAIAAANPISQVELKKQILYRAANLAVGMRDFPLAEQLYRDLLGLDPAFKDARDRLDKIPQIRDKG